MLEPQLSQIVLPRPWSMGPVDSDFTVSVGCIFVDLEDVLIEGIRG